MPTSLSGVFTVMPTPFKPDGQVDLADIERLVNFLVAQQVDGLTILGVTGEAAKLTEAEREAILKETLATVAGRIPVVVGTSHSSATVVIHYSKVAEEHGAAGLMISAPPVAKHNLKAVEQHFASLAGAVRIPIVLQDFPPENGIFMPAEFMAELASAHPMITRIKLEDPPTAPKIAQVLHAVRTKIGVFGGLGGTFFLHELQAGAIGTMTGFAYPEILVSIFRKYKDNDLQGAEDTYYRFLPLLNFEAQPGIGLAIRKEIFKRRGAISSATVRDSTAPLSPLLLKQLDATLARVGLA